MMKVRFALTIPVVIVAMLAVPAVSSAQSIGPVAPAPPRTLYPPTQLVQNGDMEQQDIFGQLASWLRTGWVTQISSTSAASYGWPKAHCGSNYTVLEAAGSGRDAMLSQTIVIPEWAQAPHLNYYVNGFWMNSSDRIQAVIATQSGALALASEPPVVGTTPGWIQEGPYDLSRFRGFTVQLVFDVNGNGNTVFGIDDVSVLTSYQQNVINLPGLC